MRVGLVCTTVALVLALPTTALATTCSSILSPGGAAVVIEGVAQPGPSAPDGLLASPATFEVLRYVKGTGPSTVEVHTGITVYDDGLMVGMITGSIMPRAGETWRILATADTDLSEPFSSGCTMFARLDEATAATGGLGGASSDGDTTAEAPAFDWAWTLLAVPAAIYGMAWRRRVAGRS